MQRWAPSFFYAYSLLLFYVHEIHFGLFDYFGSRVLMLVVP